MNKKAVAAAIAVGAAAIILIKHMAKKTTTKPAATATGTYPNHNYTVRGYRNNNPLNIKISASAWNGKISPSGDPTFEQFRTMAYGFRAAFKLISNYPKLYNARTVAEIIAKWDYVAQVNYTNTVCRLSGLTPSTVIDPKNKAQMTALVRAMAQMENGQNIAVPEDALNEGWNLYIS